MERTKRRRRSANNGQLLENHYKVLGVRSNARPETIKKAYIQRVKACPPETHPAEFQEIRRAYEVLRDPVKRRDYDLLRNHGEDLDSMMEEVASYVNRGDWNKAVSILERVVKMHPSFIPAYGALATIALMEKDEKSFAYYFETAIERATTDDERIFVLAHFAEMHLSMEHAEIALTLIERLDRTYPDRKDEWNGLRIQVYCDVGREEEAWGLMTERIPTLEAQNPDDLKLFIDWVNLLIQLEKWSLWSKVGPRVRKFLRILQDDDDKEAALLALLQEHDACVEVDEFRGAIVFLELAKELRPRDERISLRLRSTQQRKLLTEEVNRLMRDEQIFPWVNIQALVWVSNDMNDEELKKVIHEDLSPMMQKYEDWNDEIAQGILRLKKRYPILYGLYQERWDEIYTEKTRGLNREARRRLRG